MNVMALFVIIEGKINFSTSSSAQLKLKFQMNFLCCLFTLITLDRLSYGLYSTMCNVYCTQCNEGTYFVVLLSRLSNPKLKLSFKKNNIN